MQDPTESLIEACKKGNQVAQMQVYDNYAQAMFTIACRYLSNKEDAKDAMQEGFLRAFANLDNYKPKATFGAWLKRIIINECLDVLKKRNIEFSNDQLETLSIFEDNDWNFDGHISKTEILDTIELLKEKYKIVIKLYLIEGYDHKEISQILDIPVKTSRTHLRRGKATLRELLKTKYNAARY